MYASKFSNLILICIALLGSTGLVEAVYHASKEPNWPHTSTANQENFDISEFLLNSNLNFSVKCETCKAMTYMLDSFLKKFEPMILDGSEIICKHGIQEILPYKPEICPGVINTMLKGAILPAITDGLLDSDVMCNFLFKWCDVSEDWVPVDLNQWVQDLLKSKPDKSKNNDFINKQYQDMDANAKKSNIKLVLMSDLHMDWDYTPGMNNDCQMPVCCRTASGPAPKPENAAQKWGDYKCDLPSITLQNMLDFIRNEIKPSGVFWGGDNVPHDLESLVETNTVNTIKNTTQLVADGLKGIPIFPTMGNHDTYPQDQIRVGGKGFEPAINSWTPSWLQFLDEGDEQSKQTWLSYGYFAKNLTSNTKVISMNSNICYNGNFISWSTFTDAGNQMEWLIDQLTELEKVNGYAIIIAHVPNLDECTRQYARRFHAITDRFQHVVRFGMMSHIHSELFQVMHDIETSKPIAMNYIVGSATTYQGNAPSFDVIYLDPDTMLPVDMQTWTFDLDGANKNDLPKWDMYIDWRSEYNLTDLSPNSFKALSEKIHTDPAVCRDYRVNSFKGSPMANRDLCSKDEQKSQYCQTVASEQDELFKCRDADKPFYKIDGEKILNAIANAINYQWYKHPDTYTNETEFSQI